MVSELAMQERMEGEFQASGTVCAKALWKGTACLVQYSRDHREFGFAGIVQARKVSRGWITRHAVCQAKERWLYLMATTGGWEAGRKQLDLRVGQFTSLPAGGLATWLGNLPKVRVEPKRNNPLRNIFVVAYESSHGYFREFGKHERCK